MVRGLVRLAMFGACALVLAAPAGARDGGLEGTRIGLLPPGRVQTAPASAESYIRHCWVLTRAEWAALRGNQPLFLDDELWTFEAEANGTPLALTRSFHYGVGADGTTEGMLKCWFVSFPAGTFAAGETVVFTGRFVSDTDYDGTAESVFEVNRTVVFT